MYLRRCLWCPKPEMRDALLKQVCCRNLTDMLWEERWLLIRPSEITGSPFSLFGAEISICLIHLLSLSAPRAPTAALNQSFIRLHIASSLMLQYAPAWISTFRSRRSGCIISVLHPSPKPADPLTETLPNHQNTKITHIVSLEWCSYF